jgi:hypothetical protein
MFTCTFAQDSIQAKRYRIALFSPLYLDSAFDDNLNYRQGKNFPKYFNPGLEFYEGAQLAIDSLEKEGIHLDIHVFDSRSSTSGISAVIRNNGLDSMDMVIGHVNANEAKMLANAVANKNIPFINATYPNDAGVSNNPNFVILNSTLFTHCAAMYRFIQKNHALSPVVLFRKKGVQEDKLKNYFEEISRTTASVPLKIKYVTLDGNFTEADLKKHLTDEGTTVAIAGSLDVNFGEHLTQMLSALYDNYPSVLFGMPTWWDVANFSKPEYKNVEVLYSTPFYVSPDNKLSVIIQQIFKSKYYSRPTDMVYRGYETLYHFAHLLALNDSNLVSSLSDKRSLVFTEFDIQPVLNPKTTTLDYFENKKIYFIKKVDGVVTAVY